MLPYFDILFNFYVDFAKKYLLFYIQIKIKNKKLSRTLFYMCSSEFSVVIPTGFEPMIPP